MLVQPSTFVPNHQAPPDAGADAWHFIFQNGRLLLRNTDQGMRLLTAADWAQAHVPHRALGYMGCLVSNGDEHHCFYGDVAEDATLPGHFSALGLRRLFADLTDHELALAGRAQQLLFWDTTHRFCGRCGARTEVAATELARTCPRCGLSRYPNPAPAIIIAVTRPGEIGSELLLVRNHRFPPDRYSVVAGFVEPGESLEDCCRREVMEEVGIAIDNVRYFASQAWPFPNSLMVGFTAEYVAGDLVLEEAEIAAAGWFHAGSLPQVPPRASIARALIDDFVARQGGDPALIADWSADRPVSH